MSTHLLPQIDCPRASCALPVLSRTDSVVVLTVQIDEVDGPEIKAVVIALRIPASEAMSMKVRRRLVGDNTKKDDRTEHKWVQEPGKQRHVVAQGKGAERTLDVGIFVVPRQRHVRQAGD